MRIRGEELPVSRVWSSGCLIGLLTALVMAPAASVVHAAQAPGRARPGVEPLQQRQATWSKATPSKANWTVVAPLRAQPLVHLATGIAVDASGIAYVSDPLEHRVKKIGFDGKVLASWGNDYSGHLHWSPRALAANRQGLVYVLTPDQPPTQVQTSSHIVAITTGGRFVRQWEVGDARAVAAGGSGNIFVALVHPRSSTGISSAIAKYSAKGRLLSIWQTPSLTDMEAEPNGIAIDTQGNVYVTVETNNPVSRQGPFITHHLYRFSSKGKLTEIKASTQLGAVQTVDSAGNIWLALSQYESGSSGALEKLSPTGKLLGKWVVIKGEQLAALHVASGPGGAIFVANTQGISSTSGWADATLIDRLSTSGKLLSRWGSIPPNKNFPIGLRLAVGPNGTVYGDAWGHGYMSISANGKRIGYAGKLTIPAQGIARDSLGNIYIDVNSPARIYKYSASGRFLTQFTASDHAYPSLENLVVDRNGTIYVIDGSEITKISASGQILATIGSPGMEPGQLSAPQSLTTGASGNIYVADTQNNRIEEFAPNGNFINSWGSTANLDRPIGVQVDPAGHIFALDPLKDDIVEFDRSGTVLARFGTPGVLPGQLDQPTDIALGPHSSLYVLDYGNNRVQKLSL